MGDHFQKAQVGAHSTYHLNLERDCRIQSEQRRKHEQTSTHKKIHVT